MTAETDLAAQVRAALEGVEGISEMKMFGGVGFMVNGNLIAGASERGLLLRIGKEQQREALRAPGIRPMEMRGRIMEDYVYADLDSEAAVRAWLQRALEFVQTLPPKAVEGEAQAEIKSASCPGAIEEGLQWRKHGISRTCRRSSALPCTVLNCAMPGPLRGCRTG